MDIYNQWNQTQDVYTLYNTRTFRRKSFNYVSNIRSLYAPSHSIRRKHETNSTCKTQITLSWYSSSTSIRFNSNRHKNIEFITRRVNTSRRWKRPSSGDANIGSPEYTKSVLTTKTSYFTIIIPYPIYSHSLSLSLSALLMTV